MSDKKSTNKKENAPAINTTPTQVVKLPFEDPRIRLTDVYVSNAVPRAADYQLWLQQHYDMAYSLGLEKGTAGEQLQGNGLTLDSTSKKLAVNITTSESGLEAIATGLKVKLIKSGGLEAKDDGLRAKLVNTGTDASYYAGAIKADADGLFINVGTGSQRKGLKGYADIAGKGVGLGIDYNGTLTIDTSGKLGVNPTAPPTKADSVRLMGLFYGATHYAESPLFTAYFGDYKGSDGNSLAAYIFINLSVYPVSNPSIDVGELKMRTQIFGPSMFSAYLYNLSTEKINGVSVKVFDGTTLIASGMVDEL